MKSDHLNLLLGSLQSNPVRRLLSALLIEKGKRKVFLFILFRISNLLFISVSPKGAIPIVNCATHKIVK